MSTSEKISFTNSDGILISGSLELPKDPIAFAIYSGCFTCAKEMPIAVHICRKLSDYQIGSLRYDPRGIGDSEGDFSKSNFVTAQTDYLSAVEYLSHNYSAPSLLVGHSWGGSLSLFLANDIASTKAIATIAAPSGPHHILKHFDAKLMETIRNEGQGYFNLAGKDYLIRKEFVEVAQKHSVLDYVKQSETPLLLLHGRSDSTVLMEEAQKIYLAAQHPKSFVSLDKMDHLLSRRRDAQYVGDLIATWSKRYLA